VLFWYYFYFRSQIIFVLLKIDTVKVGSQKVEKDGIKRCLPK